MRSFPSHYAAAVVLLVTATTTIHQASAQSSNIVTINQDQRLARFSQFLDRVGVSTGNAQTLFVPTGQAFNDFEAEFPDKWTKYSSQPEFFVHLKELITWHLVTEGAYTVAEIFDGQRQSMENENGKITINQRFQQIDNVPATSIISPDIATSQGILHVLDKVIEPPFLGYNMIQLLLGGRDYVLAFSNMANLALFVELEDRINDAYENGLTFLVPPNIRFNRAEIDIPSLLTPEMRNFTRDFILSHMIKRNWHEQGVFGYHEEIGEDQHLVLSELGTHMWITTTEKVLKFQSIDVIMADQPSENGYVSKTIMDIGILFI